MSFYRSAINLVRPTGSSAGWVWPVPIWKGRDPEISDAFDPDDAGDDKHRQHLGADIMFRRLSSEAPEVLPYTSKRFAMPDGVPALAAGAGTITKAVKGAKGHAITISHGQVGGRNISTFYQHLKGFIIPWKEGMKVNPGTALGEIGGDPSGYPLQHLHFGIYIAGKGPVDPLPFLKRWPKLSGDSLGNLVLGPVPGSGSSTRVSVNGESDDSAVGWIVGLAAFSLATLMLSRTHF